MPERMECIVRRCCAPMLSHDNRYDRKAVIFTMLHAVIDIGSNTIRLSVYECTPDRSFSPVIGRKVTAGLAGYVKDGEMQPEGIAGACSAVAEFRALLSRLAVESVSAFATASLRNISNTKQAVDAIQRETGFRVDVISGKEEARLDFLGATRAVSVTSGLLVDVGGGSCELVGFSDRRMEQAASIPAGSLSLFSGYVEELFPTYEERCAICARVQELLGKPGLDFGKRSVVCGVGGTLRSAAKLCKQMCGSDGDGFTVKDFKKVLGQLTADNKLALSRILRAAPERVHTLLPGMLLFEAVADRFECERVVISRYGVREGYLIDRVLAGMK